MRRQLDEPVLAQALELKRLSLLGLREQAPVKVVLQGETRGRETVSDDALATATI